MDGRSQHDDDSSPLNLTPPAARLLPRSIIGSYRFLAFFTEVRTQNSLHDAHGNEVENTQTQR
jgi:hypothetical protein